VAHIRFVLMWNKVATPCLFRKLEFGEPAAVKLYIQLCQGHHEVLTLKSSSSILFKNRALIGAESIGAESSVDWG